ncbi:maleylpyruvate isomerase N-terminal domain-containing protein [Pseudonocardia sp.]|uniref:maleylpyruvate isomerase N-terminal domain-containing protein n=1 Tax=Pseudonocardia sp. TaxID=60912 RepID=UPI003D11BE37
MSALDPTAGASLAADVTTGVTAAWRAQNEALADLLRTHDLDTTVPTCPGWTLANLATHVGRGDRWAATMVARRMDTVLDPREVPDGKPPEGGAVDWLLAGVDALATAVARTGPTTPVWTFTGPQPAAWWLRRRLHECVVHRADAALAVGAAFEVPADVAADGVSEWLTLLAARPGSAEHPLGGVATMHLHATDDGLGTAGEWMIRPAGDGVTWEPGHAKGTVAVRGPAAELLLVLLRRLPPERVEVLGDAAVLDTWLARTGF